jgi:nitrous oxide reductase
MTETVKLAIPGMEEKMKKLSRRAVLQRASVTLAAGAALSGAAQPAGAATRSSRSRSAQAESATSEPIVAYLGRGTRGEVRLLVGDREIIHRDPDLARRLRAAAG